MSDPGQPQLDHDRLDALLTAACERLDGEWLLVGGALVALWLEPGRVTQDIDLIGLRGVAQERYALVDFAVSQGLPAEAVNSAADYFVQKIDGWRGELELFRSGTRGRIFRPSPTLFLLLKLGRLSPRDLADCEALCARAAIDRLPIDRVRLFQALGALAPPADAELALRRESLRQAIQA